MQLFIIVILKKLLVMNSPVLPLELELAVLEIATSAYSNTRYSFTTKIEKYSIDIEFEGFFTENFDHSNRPYQDPSSNFYRNPKVDFSITYFYESKCLIVSGWWRRCMLSLYYEKASFLWLNEDGEEIVRPYPDGDRFEDMAVKLLPILQKYFNL